MTPCEQLGHREGDLFLVTTENRHYEVGSLIELWDDDGTDRPYFKLVEGALVSPEGDSDDGVRWMGFSSRLKKVGVCYQQVELLK